MNASIYAPAHQSRITFPRPTEDPKGWGKEIILINCPDYCSKILCFTKGGQGSMHFHDQKHETWYVLMGRVKLSGIDMGTAEPWMVVLKGGDMVDIPRLCAHQVLALEDTQILEVSTPHLDSDTFRVAKGDGQREEAST
jgi:mannose-6-phosphate isomerase